MRNQPTVPDAPFIDSKGGQRSWLDLRSHLNRLLRERFPKVDDEIIQDALGDCMVDLLGYWQRKYRTADEPMRFAYALIRGMHTGTTAVRTEIRHVNTEVSYAFRSGGADVDHDALSSQVFDIADPDPLPDELVAEHDEIERARLVLGALPTEQLLDYFTLLESGLSQRDIARQLGISQQAVSKRTNRARKTAEEDSVRLRNYARKYGLNAPA